MLLSKYAKCDSKNPKINKHEEASVLPSSLGIKQYFKIIPLADPLCFNSIKQINTRYKMNEKVNKFLSARDKFMPKMHLRRLGFTYSACGPFTKIQSKNAKI